MPDAKPSTLYRFAERQGTRDRFRWFMYASLFNKEEIELLETQCDKRTMVYVSFAANISGIPDTFSVADSVENVKHLGDGWFKQN